MSEENKMEEFVSYVENLTVLELSKLVKTLEERRLLPLPLLRLRRRPSSMSSWPVSMPPRRLPSSRKSARSPVSA